MLAELGSENPELTTLESTPRGCASAETSHDRTRQMLRDTKFYATQGDSESTGGAESTR